MRSIIAVLLFLFSVLEPLPSDAAFRRGAAAVVPSGFNGGGTQINRFVASYYNGMNRWLNIWNQGASVCIVSSLNGTVCGASAWNATGASGQPYFNSTTGELNIPVQTDVTAYGRGVFTSPDEVNVTPGALYGPPGGAAGAQGKWWLGLVMNLEWTGTISTSGTKVSNSGTFGTGGTTGFGTVGGCGTRCVTATYGTTDGPTNLALFFTIDASNRADPPRLVKYYPSQFVTQARSADLATSLINPDWLTQWGAIGKIRWMQENGEVNISGITDFSQLAEYTFNTFAANASFYAPQGQTYPPGAILDYGPKGAVGPQTVCAVQNKVGAHAHYTIPWGANSTFSMQLAQAFDGCMNQGLETHYEYCNEIWNFGAAFQCFYYLNRQAWPPLGASVPYQQAVSITSVTTGAVTTINGTNNFTNGQIVSFAFSTSDTISTALNIGWYQVANRTGSSFQINVNTTGLSYSSGGTTFASGAAALRGGYNSAKQMQQIYDAYGSSKRARWKGVLGGQLTASGGSPLSAILGVMFYITNESVGSGACAPNLCITDLYDKLEIAPYSGNPAYNGLGISSITQSATPTVTMSAGNCSDVSLPCISNGSLIRLYAATGMTQIDDMTATVSNLSGNTFNININTSAMSAWAAGPGNFFIGNALPKAADDSIALNISTPGTYPTKYAYFAEQMTDAILNGTSVSNPSFGYSIIDGGNYRSYASCGITCIPGILIDNATLANSYGLQLDEYEAAPFSSYVCTAGSPCFTDSNRSAGAAKLWDFFWNWPYDAGTATHGPANISTAHVQAGIDVGVSMPSIFNEAGSGPGPFNLTRYFGDNPAYLGPLFTKNAAGPYTKPRPAKTWTASFGTIGAGDCDAGSSRCFTSSGCNGCTDSWATTIGTAATRVYMGVSGTGGNTGNGYPTAITCGGQSLTRQPGYSDLAAGVASIWAGDVPSGTATRTCNIQYTGTDQNGQYRSYYVATVTGLTSTTPTYSTAATTQIGNVKVTADSDSLVFMMATRPSFLGYMTGVDTPVPSNPTTQIIAQEYDGAVHAAGFSMFHPSFQSPIFQIGASTGSTGAMSVLVVH